MKTPQERLRHHVNAAIARGEAPITEIAPGTLLAACYKQWEQLRRDGSTRMSWEAYKACTYREG